MTERTDLDTLYLDVEPPVARCTLNRPEVRNAFNAQMIQDIIRIVREVDPMKDVHVLVLTGAGSAFSAGADLNWMESMRNYSREENIADAEALADCMRAIYDCGKVTVARVNGATIGGGNGLVCACDIAVAAEEATFGLSEAKIGLVPAAIGPYVIRRIGEGNAMHLMLTGLRFNGSHAVQYGLVHLAVPRAQLDEEVNALLSRLASSGPQAMRTVKELVRNVPRMSLDDARTYTAKMIAELRTSEEGQEGISAFLENRKPKWAK